MIALDTNVLVAAYRPDHPHHAAAREALAALGSDRWALPWPVVHEFVAVVTNPRIFARPTPIAEALAVIEQLLVLPAVTAIGESARHPEILRRICGPAVGGAKVHDARVAAICLGHDVRELVSFDRDFSLFPELAVRNPLAATA